MKISQDEMDEARYKMYKSVGYFFTWVNAMIFLVSIGLLIMFFCTKCTSDNLDDIVTKETQTVEKHDH